MNRCDIVQDLLPLHVDGILRPSTDDFVREHVLQCKTCEQARNVLLESSGKWEQYSSEMEAFITRLEGEKAFVSDIKKWRRRAAWAFVSIVAAIAVFSWMIGKFSG